MRDGFRKAYFIDRGDAAPIAQPAVDDHQLRFAAACGADRTNSVASIAQTSWPISSSISASSMPMIASSSNTRIRSDRASGVRGPVVGFAAPIIAATSSRFEIPRVGSETTQNKASIDERGLLFLGQFAFRRRLIPFPKASDLEMFAHRRVEHRADRAYSLIGLDGLRQRDSRWNAPSSTRGESRASVHLASRGRFYRRTNVECQGAVGSPAPAGRVRAGRTCPIMARLAKVGTSRSSESAPRRAASMLAASS